MKHTGFTMVTNCFCCKKPRLCLEYEDEQGYCMLVCDDCEKGLEEES